MYLLNEPFQDTMTRNRNTSPSRRNHQNLLGENHETNSTNNEISILSRYIENLPCRRITRAHQASSRIQNRDAARFPVKTLSTSFDQLSDYSSLGGGEGGCPASLEEADDNREAAVQYATSDYSSNSSAASSGGGSDKGKHLTTTQQSPASDISSNYRSRDPSPVKGLLPSPIFVDGDLRDTGWDSDNADNQQPECSWELEAETQFYRSFIEQNKGRLLRQGDVHLLLPPTDHPVRLRLLTSPHLMPNVGLRVHHVSPIVSVTPAGDMFSTSHPAYLFLPLRVLPDDPSWLACLYTTTRPDQPPAWTPLDTGSYHYHEGHIVLQTCCLATFTVVYREPLPHASKRIRRRIGGSLKIPDLIPGLKISFPRGACPEDITASMKVLYDYEPWDPTTDTRGSHGREAEGGLASPILMLGPHGYQFDTRKKPVEIEVPIPHYREILELFPRARLIVYQSSTKEGEPLEWTKLDIDRISIHHYKSGLISASFPVHHFSFFKTVWDILSGKLYEAKMGVSYFYPWVSFPMKCQAYMEENPDNNSFGLEVICFNSENDKEMIQTSNYRYMVGSSLKPKLVRPGRISVRLKSQKFMADEAAGEDQEMVKDEPDFRGRDFEKQFACIFKDGSKVDRGTFGKVAVERIAGAGNSQQENLFEFNLRKSGQETEMTPPDNTDRWSVVAVKELAGHLALTEETNWKHFASYIGFTKQEIRSKLQYADDPFLSMMNLYQNRGGTPEEFVQALYSVSRDMSVGTSGGGSTKSQDTPGSTSSGVSGSGSQSSTNGLPKRLSFFGLNPWRSNPEDSDSGTADMNASPAGNSSNSKDSRKRPRPPPPSSRNKSRSSGAAPAKKTRVDKASNAGGRGSDNSYSSSDESGAEEMKDDAKSVSTDKHKRNPYKLSDQDLWLISAHMNAINWRALGRTLGLEESILLNLEHAHKGSGFRECAYQMLLEWKGMKPKSCTFGNLYNSLTTEKMNSVAKHMATLLSQGSLVTN